MTRRILFSLTILVLAVLGFLFWSRVHLRKQPSVLPHVNLPPPVQVLKLKPDINESLKNLSRNDATYFHSWPILETRSISDAEALRLATILNDGQSYGTSGEKCFEPEWAIRSTTGTEILLSLKCGRIHLINKNDAQISALSPKGLNELSAALRN